MIFEVPQDDAKTSPRHKLAQKNVLVSTHTNYNKDVTALRQVWKKDEPVVFDVPTRITNASQRETLKSPMREPARAGASDAYELRSVGWC